MSPRWGLRPEERTGGTPSESEYGCGGDGEGVERVPRAETWSSEGTGDGGTNQEDRTRRVRRDREWVLSYFSRKTVDTTNLGRNLHSRYFVLTHVSTRGDGTVGVPCHLCSLFRPVSCES